MLIKSIEINNFRCFHKTTAKDFSTINLFGGKNNAGKTALLEALFLITEPSSNSIMTLVRVRHLDDAFMRQMPKNAWDNFFCMQSPNDGIKLLATTDELSKQEVLISRDESIDEFVNFVENDTFDKNIVDIAKSLRNSETTKSTLHIVSSYKSEPHKEFLIVASSNGIIGKGTPYSFIKTRIIPASFKRVGVSLASEFSRAKLELNWNTDLLLKAYKIIDESIEEITVESLGSPAIYLKRKNEKPMPLTLFGDAMSKITDYILWIVNNQNSILLIDEIENGIHHSNQEMLWKMLFDLAKEFGVQIFATSHSEEMIKAFENVIKINNLEADGRYFEMARHTVTNEITIQKIPINVLEERLITQKPVRGE